MARVSAIKDALLVDENLTADRVMIDTARVTVAITDTGWTPMKLELDASAIATD
jgi:hypothetical protein